MGWMEDTASGIGDFFGLGDDSPSSSSSSSGGGIPSNWYSEDRSGDYDDLFELPGTVKEDSSWWSSALDLGGKAIGALNTPLGVGVIGGLAQGYQGYQANKAVENQSKYTRDQLEKHNKLIAAGPPEDMAKRVKVIR